MKVNMSNFRTKSACIGDDVLEKLKTDLLQARGNAEAFILMIKA